MPGAIRVKPLPFGQEEWAVARGLTQGADVAKKRCKEHVPSQLDEENGPSAKISYFKQWRAKWSATSRSSTGGRSAAG
eukprot:9683561-Heterocapsa_arctica.AAC.1